MIDGVYTMSEGEENNTVMTDLTNYNHWLSDAKKTGKHTIRVEVFFTIQITKELREIIEADLPAFKQDRVRVDVKRTDNQHTTRLGYLTGPILDRVNLTWYDRMLKYVGKLNEGSLEVRKDFVYEGQDANHLSITIHGITAERDKIDYNL